ncbi:RNA 2',3'-cyclic phosphodiesterase [Reinekea thalattae]|uniref:RNA 2',3'-cyclic phosphodiesterase n=1 Tax=Reinekea thalattae TaxID=2593301 RepID=A0A5C8Z9U3_9GAMM|nr:RNA 2',3'-cyclic phosphodiesterase [Reinekea thalattae]TXR54865.1 RNA 2',3'-cyclic phosphodiesterase [Reinekea thalattae]
MRLFFALSFDSATKKRITPFRDWVIKEADKGQFTRDANYHLTLEFLGEISDEKVPALIEIIHQLGPAPAELRVNRIDAFEKRNKQILWLGIEHNHPLMTLQTQLIQRLQQAGFETQDRPYRPHITLGRRIVLNKPLDAFQFADFTIPVRAIALIESRPEDDQVIYEAKLDSDV